MGDGVLVVDFVVGIGVETTSWTLFEDFEEAEGENWAAQRRWRWRVAEQERRRWS